MRLSSTLIVMWAGNMRKHACLETIEAIITGKSGVCKQNPTANYM